jgi:hypothetical protein
MGTGQQVALRMALPTNQQIACKLGIDVYGCVLAKGGTPAYVEGFKEAFDVIWAHVDDVFLFHNPVGKQSKEEVLANLNHLGFGP